MRLLTFGFYKVRGISRLAEELAAYQEGLCSMELGSYHSIYEIITAPGITITGMYRQLQDSSFIQRSVTSTRLHHVTAQKTSVICLPSLRTCRRNLLQNPEEGGSMSFRNDADHVPMYAVSVRRRQPK